MSNALYRLRIDLCDCDHCDLIRSVLVPVERCEHDKIDPHPYTTNGEVWAVTIPSDNIETCPGAWIGGDEDE